jgi:N-acetylneuraminate synthase
LTLLKCTSTYPATPENSNLLTIPYLRERYGCEIGLSDHTLGIGSAIASVALGATVIEKHFTLKRADGGVDSAFSMEPNEMKQLVEETGRAWESMGKVFVGPTEAEKSSITFRRSLYIVKDLKAGDVLTQENVRAIRPGLGLPPKHLNYVLGMVLMRNVNCGTALSLEMLSNLKIPKKR